MKTIISFFLKILLLLNSKYKIKLLNKTLRIFNDYDKNFFFSYNYRKKFFKESKNKIKNKISIIVQGPIIRKNNFTLNSINLYLRNCNSNIILSTWENELSNLEIKSLKKKGVNVLINKLPEIKGPSNLNYQILSTLNAIKISKLKKNNFIIKTRTDFRIYLEEFDIKILKLFNNFKQTNKFLKIGSTNSTLQNRLFSVSDNLMFGATNNLYDYFSRIYSNKEYLNFNIFLKKQKKEKFFLKESYICFPENFLCYNYLKFKLNRKIKYNSKNYLDSLKKYFVIIDNSILDIFWYKYNHQYEYREKDFSLNKKNYPLRLLDWINLNKLND